jgi:uncharacterized protein YjiS (DUF1127 family)
MPASAFMRPAHGYGVTSAHHLLPARPYLPCDRFAGAGHRGPAGCEAANGSMMNPRSNQEQIGLFPVLHTQLDPLRIEALRAEAVAARDAALAALFARMFRGIATVVGVVFRTLLTWPQRRATYETLRRLSDRELADIGLVRGDIARVFEPDFALPLPANSNAASRRAA